MYVLVYVQGRQNHKRASDTPTLESHAAVSQLVGARAGTWPWEKQQVLLTAELPLQPHGISCEETMKEQYWLLPAGILNPYGSLYSLNGSYGCFYFNIYYLFGKYWFTKLHRYT